MAKGVLVHRPDSIYDDLPWERYQFPSRYLKRIKQMVGDWIVYYEPRRSSGRSGYNAIARIQQIVPDPSADGLYIAQIEPGSYQPLEIFVPYRSSNAGYLESSLNDPNGSLNRGLMQWSVRPLSEEDFSRILELSSSLDAPLLPREGFPEQVSGFAEAQEPFVFEDDRTRSETLIRMLDRNRSFRRQVLRTHQTSRSKWSRSRSKWNRSFRHCALDVRQGPNWTERQCRNHYLATRKRSGPSTRTDQQIGPRAVSRQSDPLPSPSLSAWHRENRLKA
jgi:hypothetical protein